MLKKIVLFTLVLVVLYTIILRFLPKDLDTNQSIWGDNVIKAQEYMYSNQQFGNVLVGTSLSSRLVTEDFGENAQNLAFSGSTVWDGLALIEAQEFKPKRVFIETTFLQKPSDQSLTTYVLNDYTFEVKKKLPILRETYQPVGVAKALLVDFLRGPTSKIPADSTEIIINPDLLKIQSEYFIRDYTEEEINSTFQKLAQKILALQKDGVEIVLYEMPLYTGFCSSEINKITRERCLEMARENNLRFLPMDNCEAYQTNDGIHLVRHSAVKFSKTLRSLTE